MAVFSKCKLCGGELSSHPKSIRLSCGGDCLICMALAGDPECATGLREAIMRTEEDNARLRDRIDRLVSHHQRELGLHVDARVPAQSAGGGEIERLREALKRIAAYPESSKGNPSWGVGGAFYSVQCIARAVLTDTARYGVDDSARLKWLAERSAQVCHASDGDCCWIRVPAERDGPDEHNLPGVFNTWREAIDAAMKPTAPSNVGTGEGA